MVKNYLDMDKDKKLTMLGLIAFACLICCVTVYVVRKQAAKSSIQSINQVDTPVKYSLVFRIHETKTRIYVQRCILLENSLVFVRRNDISKVPAKDGFHFAEKGDTVFYQGNNIIRIGLKHD